MEGAHYPSLGIPIRDDIVLTYAARGSRRSTALRIESPNSAEVAG
jgi:hypothetical protein